MTFNFSRKWTWDKEWKLNQGDKERIKDTKDKVSLSICAIIIQQFWTLNTNGFFYNLKDTYIKNLTGKIQVNFANFNFLELWEKLEK